MSAKSEAKQKQIWKLYVYRVVIVSIIVVMLILSILQF